jgi:hypothetical protein
VNFYKLNDKIVNRVEELSDSQIKYFLVVLSYSSDTQWNKDFKGLKEIMGVRTFFRFCYPVILFVVTLLKLLIRNEKK